MQRRQLLTIAVLLTTSIGCDKATQTVGSLRDSVVEAATGTKASPVNGDAGVPAADALDSAAESLSGIQEAMAGVIGGTGEQTSQTSEGGLARYQWKANRNGREQARMLASPTATEDGMKQSAVNLVQQIGGRRWIVAFYSNIRSVEDWTGRTAVDRKSDSYLGSVVLDAGRPPKIRFHAATSSSSPSSDFDEAAESMSDKDAQHAEMLLRSAKGLLSQGKEKTAKFQLQAIVRRYPTSGVASEALSLLAELKQ